MDKHKILKDIYGYDGVCIIISPLISLMKDQVTALVEVGVHAADVNGVGVIKFEKYGRIFMRMIQEFMIEYEIGQG